MKARSSPTTVLSRRGVPRIEQPYRPRTARGVLTESIRSTFGLILKTTDSLQEPQIFKEARASIDVRPAVKREASTGVHERVLESTSRLRNAASPASDTATHFASGETPAS